MRYPRYRLNHFFFILLLTFGIVQARGQSSKAPLRLAVAGVSHGHVPWILERKGKTDVALVGVYEPDHELGMQYAKRYHLSPNLFFTDLDKMLDAVKPEAVVAFGPISEHLPAVEACAPRGIHVMVEKPLAAQYEQALRMEELARKNKIFLLTNYETSWYPTTQKAYELAFDSNFVGSLKKVVFHHGHQGPKEIGVSPEFLKWLTDPKKNDGGALIDFGCYGANIMSYLMQGQNPVSVTAVTQHFKPGIYPNVDDEATIIVSYPTSQCVIQASWNWPFSRKDMEVYGDSGYIITVDNYHMRVRNNHGAERKLYLTPNEVPVYTDPFSYLADVVRGKITVPINSLYSLENNLKVVRILDAARQSANTGKSIMLTK